MMEAIRALVNAAQTISPDIGAYVYPEKNLVIIWAKGLILDKILLNNKNFSNPNFVKRHLRKIELAIAALNSLPKQDFENLIKQSSRLKLGSKI
jgi:hypothetical protein